MHPAIVKASSLGNLAGAHQWKGQLDSEVVGRERKTNLQLVRNDEAMAFWWTNQTLSSASYSIFDSTPVEITSKSQLLGFVTGWPNLIQLFDTFPKFNRPNLVQRYRRLPFRFDESNDEIIDSLIGCTLWWYDREISAVRTDTVKSKRDKRFRIVDVGHRKLFHCVMVETNFRSILLDQLIQVGG